MAIEAAYHDRASASKPGRRNGVRLIDEQLTTDLILRSAPLRASRRMVFSAVLAAILRDGASRLLRMTVGIASLRMTAVTRMRRGCYRAS
jgi:hypothetical protein